MSRGDVRSRNMAIGVAAQFELALRQKDIIGEWGPAVPKVAGVVYAGTEMWTGSFRWENIPGWRLRLKTSKNRARAEFCLDDYPMLFPLLEAVPHAERSGAIVKGQYGLPIRERSYRKWFREIARASASMTGNSDISATSLGNLAVLARKSSRPCARTFTDERCT